MDATDDFFSWTSRRAVIGTAPRAATAPETVWAPDDVVDDSPKRGLDVRLVIAGRHCRLITFTYDGDDFVVVIIGSVRGRHDVPVRAVDQESLLVDARRTSALAEILIGIPIDPTTVDPVRCRERMLASQLLRGGPIRQMVSVTEVYSVLVPVLAPVQRAA
ncbi:MULTISPECIES: hypothetical protein [unclassified Rhodococcus (in: high G+C Gram-positive bacteria)]|uniref:hypothetical protein n=1 Tax=unclassified Rhodococcus (in: high G+C Gram-positive bacteria) TaxID=192944 RepID=UPI00215B9441|nr:MULTISPECIES: hypothetical protein [unclassified Rhodococcus (in: high G+C Gram-positive bacteria)]